VLALVSLPSVGTDGSSMVKARWNGFENSPVLFSTALIGQFCFAYQANTFSAVVSNTLKREL
jgi:hypothetical protein